LRLVAPCLGEERGERREERGEVGPKGLVKYVNSN